MRRILCSLTKHSRTRVRGKNVKVISSRLNLIRLFNSISIKTMKECERHRKTFTASNRSRHSISAQQIWRRQREIVRETRVTQKEAHSSGPYLTFAGCDQSKIGKQASSAVPLLQRDRLVAEEDGFDMYRRSCHHQHGRKEDWAMRSAEGRT